MKQSAKEIIYRAITEDANQDEDAIIDALENGGFTIVETEWLNRIDQMLSDMPVDLDDMYPDED